jgi:hypothetical protein
MAFLVMCAEKILRLLSLIFMLIMTWYYEWLWSSTLRMAFRNICCQATLKTEPLPTPKTEPPPTSGGRLFSEPFRLGLAGGWFGACSWFSCPVGLVGRSFVRRSCRWGCSGCSP